MDKITQKRFHFELLTPSTDSRFTPVKIWIAHTGRNLNKSVFNKDVLQNMIQGLAYTTIVGFIEAGGDVEKPDFKGHEERYIFDDDGLKTEYLGKMYGFVPKEHNARFETKEVNGIA